MAKLVTYKNTKAVSQMWAKDPLLIGEGFRRLKLFEKRSQYVYRALRKWKRNSYKI